MSDFTIYHNPRCSNSRNALALLREHGVAPRVVEYLKTPLAEKDLAGLFQRYDGPPGDLLRFKEKEAAEQNITPESPSTALIAAILAAPILLQRPIVATGGRVLIARPPAILLPMLEGAAPGQSKERRE